MRDSRGMGELSDMKCTREIQERLRREKEKMIEEIVQCIAFAALGPHAFLVVIRADRFTKEEQITVERIQIIFGEKAACYTMALFTYGDNLEADEVLIEDLIKDNEHLCDFVNLCGGGYHVFNNRRRDPSQVRELLKKINTMVEENGGSYYTTEMLREAERIIIETKESIRREYPNMSPEEERRQAERDKRCIGSKAALSGVGVGIGTAIGVGVECGTAIGVGVECGTAIGVGVICGIMGAAAEAIGGPVGAAAGALVGVAVGVAIVVVVKKASKKK